jgi:hypothetical protein
MASQKPEPTCPGCGSSELYVTVKAIGSGGGHAPDLLPGLHPWYRSARLRGVLCGHCGLYRQYAEAEALRMLRNSPKWQRL